MSHSRQKVHKNSFGFAKKLKSKFIQTLKESPSSTLSLVEYECEQLLEEIKTNTQILNQIKFLDEEIVRLQLEIAETASNYQFVQEIQREHEKQETNQPQNQVENLGQAFLQQRDLRTKLLSHLKVVQRTLSDVGYDQILGITNSHQNDKTKQNEALFRRPPSIIDTFL